MKILILLLTCVPFFEFTSAMIKKTNTVSDSTSRESISTASSPITSPQLASTARANIPRVIFPIERTSVASTHREITRKISSPRACPPLKSQPKAMLPRGIAPKLDPPIANPSTPLGDSFARDRVFVHLRDDRVFYGYLYDIPGLMYPRWVLKRFPGYVPLEGVYVRGSSGEGVVSVIEPLHHKIDINDDIPEKHRCWMSLKSGTLLSANLHRYNYEQLPNTNKLRCYVRIPDECTVYVGELDSNFAHRPSWLL